MNGRTSSTHASSRFLLSAPCFSRVTHADISPLRNDYYPVRSLGSNLPTLERHRTSAPCPPSPSTFPLAYPFSHKTVCQLTTLSPNGTRGGRERMRRQNWCRVGNHPMQARNGRGCIGSFTNPKAVRQNNTKTSRVCVCVPLRTDNHGIMQTDRGSHVNIQQKTVHDGRTGSFLDFLPRAPSTYILPRQTLYGPIEPSAKSKASLPLRTCKPRAHTS